MLRDRDKIEDLFRRHGARGEIRYAVSESADEVVFVLSPEGAASMNESVLSRELQSLLSRKVAITTSPPWPEATRPL
jgi:hypothetical protein